MSGQNWTIEGLPWDRFDPAKIDPSIVPVIKAAAMVEHNSRDYARYLSNIFADDPCFQALARDWAEEEVQHGEALGRWAERADPSFDFEKASARYKAGYRISVDAQNSIRGSRAGELIARCIVETGTSSYYSALGDAAEEPVLKAICRAIAADEFRHYKMFYNCLTAYLGRESLNRLQRLKIGLARIGESEDDELAYAYYAANAPEGAVYDHKAYSAKYAAHAYRFYRRQHVARVVAMVFKACGLRPSTVWQGMVSRAAWQVLKIRNRRAIRQAA
ncbi:MAG TPA: ferritin-like domain-containing protein [Alphaproteobacteria bacterium]|nr:ferritin-like domain-containing protein [Alphaproteobacteria bacterium]